MLLRRLLALRVLSLFAKALWLHWRRLRNKRSTKMKSKYREIAQEVGHTRASKTVHVSFPVEVLKKIQTEAKKCGLPCSAWLRMKALEAAEEK